jgi:DNA invertase Pin-like site-specific DNA recombinase
MKNQYNKDMVKAVIYTRVSTDEQVDNFSLGFQEDECIRYAERMNYDIVQVFKEEGASAKNFSGRKVMLELIRYCQRKENKGYKVIVYKLDRWSRNTQEGLGMMALSAKNGVEVLSATEPVINNSIGKFVVGVLLLNAEYENNNKSERTTSGMKAAFSLGYWPWKAPIGYKHATIAPNKILQPVESYTPILVSLFNNAATGVYTRKELAIQLNNQGFPLLYGAEANEKIVDRILKNPFYYGQMKSLKWKEQVTGNHTPIIDEITWQKAQQGVYKIPAPKIKTNYDPTFPLRQFLRCDTCNHPLTASFSKGVGGKYGYYHCAKKNCTTPARISINKAHEAFDEYLHYFQIKGTRMKLFQAVLLDKMKEKLKDQETVIRNINNFIDELKEKKLGIISSLQHEVISNSEAKEMLEDIRAFYSKENSYEK